MDEQKTSGNSSEITWGQLTEAEREAFNHFVAHQQITNSDFVLLASKDILDMETSGNIIITSIGEELLAQADTAQAATEARPTTITAADFVRDGYASKIAAGECVVYDTFPMEKVRVINVFVLYDGKNDFHIQYADVVDDPVGVNGDCKFTVTWLTPQPAPSKAEAGAGAEETIDTTTRRTVTMAEAIKISHAIMAEMEQRESDARYKEAHTYNVDADDFDNMCDTLTKVAQILDEDVHTGDEILSAVAKQRAERATLRAQLAAAEEALDVCHLELMATQNTLEAVAKQRDELTAQLAAAVRAKQALAEETLRLRNWVFDTLSTISEITYDLSKKELLAIWKSLGKQAAAFLANDNAVAGDEEGG